MIDNNPYVYNSDLKISKHFLSRVTTFTFMVPYFVYVVSAGETLPYRVLQFAWLILAFGSILYFWKYIARPSKIFIALIATLLCAIFVASINAMSGSSGQISTLIKVASLALYFWYFDAFRFLGTKYFFSKSVFMASLILIVSLIHFLFFPDLVYGRHTYFNMHPNLGGEIIFGCLIVLALSRERVIFLILVPICIFMLELLQARAALIASILLALLYIQYHYKVLSFNVKRLQLLFFALIGFAFLLAILSYAQSSSPISLLEFILNDVLLLNDPHRGVGSGLSGRDHTWTIAIQLYSQSPIFGVGLDGALVNEDGLRVHSGPILLLTEFGLVSVLLFYVLISGAWRTAKSDRIAFAVLISCFIVFLFQARGLNTNIFPLAMWIVCLPWVHRSPN